MSSRNKPEQKSTIIQTSFGKCILIIGLNTIAKIPNTQGKISSFFSYVMNAAQAKTKHAMKRNNM